MVQVGPLSVSTLGYQVIEACARGTGATEIVATTSKLDHIRPSRLPPEPALDDNASSHSCSHPTFPACRTRSSSSYCSNHASSGDTHALGRDDRARSGGRPESTFAGLSGQVLGLRDADPRYCESSSIAGLTRSKSVGLPCS